MGTAARTAPLRRTGSLLGLLGLEVAAVLGLHWLGRSAGLRIRWDQPVPWLLNSPVQNVLGSVLRMVALVMAYWLLASTVAYLLASLTRLPGAVRAVGWATLPLVRRVADHAVAVTLATSMVGGTTLGVAGPALAADGRGLGPPAPKPAAPAGAGAQDGPATTEPEPTRTSEPVYTPNPAGHAPTTTAPQAAPSPPTTEPPTTKPPATAEAEPTRTSKPVYTPHPAGHVPRRLQAEPTTTTAGSTTTTTTAAAEPTTTTATTLPRTTATPSPKAPASTAAPATRQGAGAPASVSTTSTTRQAAGGGGGGGGGAHAYTPGPASDPTEAARANPGGRTTPTASTTPGSTASTTPGSTAPTTPGSTTRTNPGSSTPTNPGGGNDQGSCEPEGQVHCVVGGDNLWRIAREHLTRQRQGGSGKPTNHEVAAYWMKVVEVNQDRLRSRDPDLIYPGERVTLPPVDQ